jgi:hypothetical protein
MKVYFLEGILVKTSPKKQQKISFLQMENSACGGRHSNFMKGGKEEDDRHCEKCCGSAPMGGK